MKNIAVIGCGQWGKNLVRNFADIGALRSIYDADVSKLAPLRDKFSRIISASSVPEILKDTKVTGVVIATSAASHYAMAKEALLAANCLLSFCIPDCCLLLTACCLSHN